VIATDAAANVARTTRAIAVAPAPIVIVGDKPTGPQKVLALVSGSWDHPRKRVTRMLELAVNELSGPEKVVLKCSGRGCLKRANTTVSKHKRTVELTKAVKGMVLHPKAKLTITVTRPGYLKRVVSYTVVAHGNPKKLVQCARAGSKRLGAC
jgi:hypothetical protein